MIDLMKIRIKENRNLDEFSITVQNARVFELQRWLVMP